MFLEILLEQIRGRDNNFVAQNEKLHSLRSLLTHSLTHSLTYSLTPDTVQTLPSLQPHRSVTPQVP